MRSPEDHLTPDELASLSVSPVDMIASGPKLPLVAAYELSRTHLEQCEECRNLAQTSWLLKQLCSASSSWSAIEEQGCFPMSAWLELATGLRANQAESMAAHAAGCASCARAWREAMELMEVGSSSACLGAVPDEPALQEDATGLTGRLASATLAWQKRLAAQITLARTDEVAAPRTGSRVHRKQGWNRALNVLKTPRFVWPLSAGLALACGLAAWIVYHSRPTDLELTNQLIAEAYTQQRTLPFRFPDARYGPLRVTRGEMSSHMQRPLPLLQAETRIASQLQSGNSNIQWLLASAYTDLLEGQYDNAVQTLRASTTLRPENPGIDIAIAIAYYERGMQNQTPNDLGEAREAIGRALDEEPRNPVALFNRALIDEGMGLYTQAIHDWQQYLLLDSAGEWSREAREHLASCQLMTEKKRKETGGSSLLTPDTLSGLGTSQVADGQIDRRIEDYQSRVFTSDYPALTSAGTNPKDRNNAIEEGAIRRLANIAALEHHDQLLRDLLHSRRFSLARIPAADLASAIAANHAGDEQQALRKAEEAATGFERIGNQAGRLRARFEVVYAMQFMSRASECAALARRLARDARRAHYPWLTAEAETQMGFCEDMEGNLSGAAEDLRFAARDASNSLYEVALDRALVGEAAIDWQFGSITTAWDLSLAGLKRFWASSAPYVRGESYCDFLDAMAEQQHKWHLQSAVLGEALALLDQENDRLAAAQVLVRLADSELMLHRAPEAKSSLVQALLIFRGAPQTPATRTQELMVRINMAKAEAANHDYLASATGLEELRPQLGYLHEDLSLIEFYTTLGEAYRKLGNAAKAAESDLSAINITQNGLTSLTRARDRLTWRREASSAYRSLVQLRIDQRHPVEALRVWQDYRRGGLFSKPVPELTRVHLGSHDKPVEPETTIIYADLPDGPFAWAVSDERIEAIPLSVTDEAITQLEDRFSEECSSPTSDIRGLMADGRRLYRILLAPFAPLLPDDGMVLIEPDDGFARIPFGALVDDQGRYLNASHTIAITPYTARPGRALRSRESPGRLDPALLVESRFAMTGSVKEDSQSAGEIETVASFFPSHTTLRPELTDKQRFLNLMEHATLFHYAGHSATSENGGALVLEERSLDGEQHSVSLNSDDLESEQLRKMKLAVLSACETDRGQGEHWLDRDNLAATLLGAGVPEVVATRWNIDSGATATLMQAFYANVIKGIGVPESLRKAVESTRQLHEYQHPYYWAAFSVLERQELT